MTRRPSHQPQHDRIQLHQYCSESESSLLDSHQTPNITDENSHVAIGRRNEHQHGWVQGALLCAQSNAGILALNVLLTLIACVLANSNASLGHGSQNSTYDVVYRGKCSVTAGWSTGLGFLINILGTGMLAASNYCMQCLSAPSRAEVDRAHAHKTWLDIGIFSTRNILLRSKGQRVLWLLLLITSSPIHFIYNSATLPSVRMTKYGIIVAPVDFGPINSLVGPTDKPKFALETYLDQSPSSLKADILHHRLERLTTQECVNEYAVQYHANRGHLVLLVDRESLDGYRSLFAGAGAQWDTDEDKFNWMRSAQSTSPSFCSKELAMEAVNAGNWSVDTRPWTDLAWTIHAEQPYREKIGFHWQDIAYIRQGISRYGFSPDSALAVDFRTLERYFKGNEPKGNRIAIDEKQLRAYLDDPANWKNRTWAAHVDFELHSWGPTYATWDDRNVGSWSPVQVHSCLSEKKDEQCELSFSLPICLSVALCNAVKVVCMFLTARQDRREIFLTVGDAMASFLTRPDPYTAGRCMMSHDSHIQFDAEGFPGGAARPAAMDAWSQLEALARHNVLVSASTSLFYNTFLQSLTDTSTLACVAVSSLLLAAGISHLNRQSRPTSLRSLWKLGLGDPNSATNFVETNGDVRIGFLTNTPQVILSAMYFLWNNLLTRMLLAVEYNDYAWKRKPLRVSSPGGQQRSSYYLSLPYRYAVPLFATSTLLQWLVSQCFYPVQIIITGAHEIPGNKYTMPRAISKVGYSPIAIILTIGLLAFATMAILALGLRKLNAQMPIAASCSAAISAACHPPAGDHDAAFKLVMWGEVAAFRPQLPTSDGLETYAHCSFTSENVNIPSAIRLYS